MIRLTDWATIWLCLRNMVSISRPSSLIPFLKLVRMEDVLDLYGEAPDQKRPVICFDESPTQLIGEVRQPIPAAPGQLERTDFEYRRNGTVNLFIFLDAHRPWRKVKVADRRTAEDFAPCMRELADVHFPEAERIRVVLDNLSTHLPGALHATLPPAEARRVLRRLEFHYTPKHASWLNIPPNADIGIWPRSRSVSCVANASTAPHRKPRAAHRRDRSLGTPTQPKRRSHQLDVLNRKSPIQNGPCLSQNNIQRVIITVQRN